VNLVFFIMNLLVFFSNNRVATLVGVDAFTVCLLCELFSACLSVSHLGVGAFCLVFGNSFFIYYKRPQRFQAMFNTKPRCTLIIDHAIDKIFNQCIR